MYTLARRVGASIVARRLQRESSEHRWRLIAVCVGKYHILEHDPRARSNKPPCSITALATHANFTVQAIWMELQDLVHAVDEMTTKTPQEAQ